MRGFLRSLTLRLIGGGNPYAGYVEACEAACRRWAFDADTTTRRMRYSYGEAAFQAWVETERRPN
jgi:hypothetical protein